MDPAFDGDPNWRVTRELRDGSSCVIRPITPEDREGLDRAFHETSPQTRYLRFGLVASTLTQTALTYLTTVDQKDHVALVATCTSPDLKTERGIGVARFVRMEDDPTVAEAAVTVIDEMQRKGVGQALTRELGRAALLRGITKLRAEVLDANTTMRVILERASARPLTPDASFGTDVYELYLTLVYDGAAPRAG